jgi:hypothetical protein
MHKSSKSSKSSNFSMSRQSRSSKSRSIRLSHKRSFTINNAYHVDGCPTKFSHKDYTGRFIAISAQRAASKALSELCHVKNIHGQCTLYIEMRETTQGSGGKLFGYHCKRIRRQKPLELYGRVILFYNKVKRTSIPTKKCKKSHKSSGRMIGYHSKLLRSHKLKKSRKQTNFTPNIIKAAAITLRKSIKRIL